MYINRGHICENTIFKSVVISEIEWNIQNVSESIPKSIRKYPRNVDIFLLGWLLLIFTNGPNFVGKLGHFLILRVPIYHVYQRCYIWMQVVSARNKRFLPLVVLTEVLTILSPMRSSWMGKNWLAKDDYILQIQLTGYMVKYNLRDNKVQQTITLLTIMHTKSIKNDAWAE